MQRWMTSGVIAAALTLGACGGVGVSYYSRSAPPPLRVETYGAAPGPGYVWVNGYWGYSGGNYAWVPGRWDRPPRGRTRWEAGRWENRRGQYRWRNGRWR